MTLWLQACDMRTVVRLCPQASAGDSNGTVVVELAHLKSYQNMGTGHVRWVGVGVLGAGWRAGWEPPPAACCSASRRLL